MELIKNSKETFLNTAKSYSRGIRCTFLVFNFSLAVFLIVYAVCAEKLMRMTIMYEHDKLAELMD